MNIYDLVFDEYYKPKLRMIKSVPAITHMQNTNDLVDICNGYFHMINSYQERFYVFGIGDDLNITGVLEIGKGTTDEAPAGIKETMIALLLTGSSRFAVAHNHPHGGVQFSQADINLTYQLKAAAKLLNIEFLDHVLITKNGFSSMVCENLI